MTGDHRAAPITGSATCSNKEIYFQMIKQSNLETDSLGVEIDDKYEDSREKEHDQVGEIVHWFERLNAKEVRYNMNEWGEGDNVTRYSILT